MTSIGKTASITLITGVPGSGKTLRAVWYAKQAVADGESVFQCNVNGCRVEGVVEFPDPTKWEDLPAGSVLIVDEAQRFFRAGSGSGAALPSCIAMMETLRHVGIRLILLTQHPALIHANIRALVGLHEHLVREDGKTSATVYTRSRVIDNVRSDKGLAAEDHHTWNFPADSYNDYDSAEVHTVKRTIKYKYKRAAVLFLVAGGIFGFVYWKLQTGMLAEKKQTPAAAATAGASQRPGGGGGGRGDEKEKWATLNDYASDHMPRFGTMPWTAPVFDQRTVTADPALYCISSGSGVDANGDHSEPSCTCLTEQGTRYDISDAQCRTVARHGQPYNPYRTAQQGPQQLAVPPVPVPRAAVDIVSLAGGAAGPSSTPPPQGAFRGKP